MLHKYFKEEKKELFKWEAFFKVFVIVIFIITVIIFIIISSNSESKSQKWIMSKMMVRSEIVLLAKNQPVAILSSVCVCREGDF